MPGAQRSAPLIDVRERPYDLSGWSVNSGIVADCGGGGSCGDYAGYRTQDIPTVREDMEDARPSDRLRGPA
jgi:hypothetical protein